MKVSIANKIFDLSANANARRFVQLQLYLANTRYSLADAVHPRRARLITERDELASLLGVPRCSIPQKVEEPTTSVTSVGASQM